MNHGKILALASMAALTLGCKAETSAFEKVSPLPASHAPATTTATQSPAMLLEQKLKKEMPYADFRKIVLADGWLPLKSESCRDNVGNDASICEQQPETESCSGDGYCNMRFEHHGSDTQLKIGRHGAIINFWVFSPAEEFIAMNSAFCTKEAYWSFFESFVRSAPVRQSLTAYPVQIRRFDTNAPIKAKYDKFRIGLSDYTWVYADSDVADEKLERLVVKETINGNAFRVNFQKAEFAPVDDGDEDEPIRTYGNTGGYQFELQDGCWRLTTEFR